MSQPFPGRGVPFYFKNKRGAEGGRGKKENRMN